MTARLTPEDVANVAKLLERLRTGEVNLIPSPAGAAPRDPSGKSEAMLQRVEQHLNEWLRRQDQQLADGGAAFPTHPPSITDMGRRIHGEAGMTLRDYFAAKAMQAEMITTFSDATPEAAEAFDDAATAAGRSTEDHLACNAYLIADAMVKARQS